MSGIRKIQKEEVIKAALELLRENGLKSVQARTIAKKLNCSTQPIFYQFANMEELKKELFLKMVEIYRGYMMPDQTSKHAYKDMGRGYIRFAKEEPEIFRCIFMSPSYLTAENYILQDEDVYHALLKHIGEVTGIVKEEDVKSFHLKMWTFTHGIATMIITRTCQISDREIDKMLTDEFTALVLLEKKRKERGEK